MSDFSAAIYPRFDKSLIGKAQDYISVTVNADIGYDCPSVFLKIQETDSCGEVTEIATADICDVDHLTALIQILELAKKNFIAYKKFNKEVYVG